ncbi:MAG TPA: glycosyltransferase family 39 protein [Myxococcales bacterium]
MKSRTPLALALLTVALHLVILGRYGWFRDELYFLACGRRLAWGYVDQPPLIALVSRTAYALSFGSLTLYRLPAALAHGGLVYLAGRFAERLGGGAVLACLAVAFAPVYAVDGHLLTMNAFEPLLYLAACTLLLLLLRGGDARLWLGVGALTGLGILNKHSFVLHAGCLLLALLLTPGRRALASRWFAGGVLVAALLVLPHAIWQVRAGFPMLELLAAQKWKNAPWTPQEFVVQQLLQLNPLAALAGLAGLRLLFREARPLALAFLLQLALFAALKGKSYYVAADWVPLIAAAGPALRRLQLPAAALLAATDAALLPIALPILPPAALARYQLALGIAPQKMENLDYGALPQHLADMFGCQELHDAVAEAAQQLAPGERAAVYTQNYGEAGALELFGSAGLPVISGHNNYFLWGAPRGLTALLIVGGRLSSHLEAFEECHEAARERISPWAMPYEQGRPIWICRRPRAPLEVLWPRVKHYQ